MVDRIARLRDMAALHRDAAFQTLRALDSQTEILGRRRQILQDEIAQARHQARLSGDLAGMATAEHLAIAHEARLLILRDEEASLMARRSAAIEVAAKAHGRWQVLQRLPKPRPRQGD